MKDIEEGIKKIIKAHMGIKLFIALSPTALFLVIVFFEEAASKAIPFVAIISTISAVTYLIRNVLKFFYEELISKNI